MMVHVGQINKTTTLTLPTEEEWRQATSEDRALRYIKRFYLVHRRQILTLRN